MRARRGCSRRSASQALATTSSGFAFTPRPARRRRDARRGRRARRRRSTQATDLPVSVDLENGYGPEPEAAARAITARRRGRRGRRLDRGLGPRRAASTTLDARGRASRSGGRGRPRAAVPVHADRARREPHPREPRPRRHDRAAAGVRGGGRRRPLCAGAARPSRRSSAVCARCSKPVNVLARPDADLRRDRRCGRSARQRRRKPDLDRRRRARVAPPKRSATAAISPCFGPHLPCATGLSSPRV